MTKTEFIYLSNLYVRQLETLLNRLTKYNQISNSAQISQLPSIIDGLADVKDSNDKVINNNYLAILKITFPKLSRNLQEDINNTVPILKSLTNTIELLTEIALDIQYAYNITHNDEYIFFSLGYTMHSLTQYSSDFNNSIPKIQTLINNINSFIEILWR